MSIHEKILPKRDSNRLPRFPKDNREISRDKRIRQPIFCACAKPILVNKKLENIMRFPRDSQEILVITDKSQRLLKNSMK